MKLRICILAGVMLALGSAAMAAHVTPKYHLIKTIQIGGDGGWDCLTMDSQAQRLYIARSNRVTVVDVKKGVVVGEVPNTQGVHGVAIVRKLNRGFASNGGDDSVTVFDLKTLKEIDRVKVGRRPDIIIYDDNSNRVFSFNGGGNDATAIDAATAKVVGTVPLGGKPEFAVVHELRSFSLVSRFPRCRIFVNLEDKGEVVEFNSMTLSILNRWPLAPGEEPTGLAFAAAPNRLFSACANEKMVVLDSNTGQVLTTVPIGKGPDGAAFDAKYNLAFSPNGQDGTLTIIHEDAKDKFSVIDTVPTQVSARTIALDSKTHKIYLAAAKFLPMPPETASVPGMPRRRPTVAPDSFVILEFGP